MASVLDRGYGIPSWRPGQLQWPVFTEAGVPVANPTNPVVKSFVGGVPRPVIAPSGTGTAALPAGGGAAAAPSQGASYFNPLYPAAGPGVSQPGALTSAATSANPFATLFNVKNPALDTRLTTLLGDFDALRTKGLGDFEAKFKATTPQFEGFLKEDLGAAGGFFDGTIQGQLEGLRAQRRTAIRASADRALGDLTRILSLGRMGGGGGTSSYLSKMGLDKASEIETAAALDETGQARSDFDFLNTAKLGLLGKRGELLNSDVNRSLLPSQVNADWFNKLQQSLLPMVNASNANSFFGLRGPGDYVGDTYGGIQSAKIGDFSRIQSGQLSQEKMNLDAILSSLGLQATGAQNQFENQLATRTSDRNFELGKEQNEINRLKTFLGLG